MGWALNTAAASDKWICRQLYEIVFLVRVQIHTCWIRMLPNIHFTPSSTANFAKNCQSQKRACNLWCVCDTKRPTYFPWRTFRVVTTDWVFVTLHHVLGCLFSLIIKSNMLFCFKFVADCYYKWNTMHLLVLAMLMLISSYYLLTTYLSTFTWSQVDVLNKWLQPGQFGKALPSYIMHPNILFLYTYIVLNACVHST